MNHIRRRIVVEDRGHHSPCWTWTGPVTHQGYGRTSVPGVGSRVRIHRATFEASKGPIPEGLCLDHLCRNRACCNPDHLEPVTAEENTRRGVRPPVPPCKHGNTPKSRCRQCHAEYIREWTARNSEKVNAKRRIAHAARRDEILARRRALREARRSQMEGLTATRETCGEGLRTGSGQDSHNIHKQLSHRCGRQF
jgi:hypothetical protein